MCVPEPELEPAFEVVRPGLPPAEEITLLPVVVTNVEPPCVTVLTRAEVVTALEGAAESDPVSAVLSAALPEELSEAVVSVPPGVT